MSKANQTQRRIVTAAMQQIASEDFFHRLQLEIIAEKAGVSEATIHYHFNKKADLSKAVWQTMFEERKPYSIQTCYETHKELLKDRAGQKKFVHLMLQSYYAFFHTGISKNGRLMIRLFFLESIGFSRNQHKQVDEYFRADLEAFHKVCCTITGVDDIVQSSLLFLFIFQPLAYVHTHITETHPLPGISRIPIDEYEQLALKHIEQKLLFHLGLTDEGEPVPRAFRKVGESN